MLVGGDADAGGDEDVSLADGERLLEALEDSLRQHECIGGIPILGVEDDELVARDTTDHAAVGERVAQSCRHRHEHVVAGLMSEGVVDVLEAVDVDEKDRRLSGKSPGDTERVLDVGDHEGSIWQVRQCIGLSGVDQLALCDGVAPHGLDDSASHCDGEHEDRHGPNDSVSVVDRIGEGQYDDGHRERARGDDEPTEQRPLRKRRALVGERRDARVDEGSGGHEHADDVRRDAVDVGPRESTRVDRCVDEVAREGEGDGACHQPHGRSARRVPEEQGGEREQHHHAHGKRDADDRGERNAAIFPVDRGLYDEHPQQEPRTSRDDQAVREHASWIIAQPSRNDVQQTYCQHELHDQEEHLGGDLQVDSLRERRVDDLASRRRTRYRQQTDEHPLVRPVDDCGHE